MNRSSWFVYLYYQPIDRWYFIPGFGYGGSTQYRISMGYSSGKVTIYEDKIGTGESYAQAKVIRIFASNTFGGTRARLPNIDFTDYEAVKNYFKLP